MAAPRLGPSRYREVKDLLQYYSTIILRAIEDVALREGGYQLVTESNALEAVDMVVSAIDRMGGKELAPLRNIIAIYSNVLSRLLSGKQREGERLKTTIHRLHRVILDYAESSVKRAAQSCASLGGRIAVYGDYTFLKECIRGRRGQGIMVIDDRPFHHARKAVMESGFRAKLYPYISHSAALEDADRVVIEANTIARNMGIAKTGARAVEAVARSLGKPVVLATIALGITPFSVNYSMDQLPRYQVFMEWMDSIYLPLYDILTTGEEAELIVETDILRASEGLELHMQLEKVWSNTMNEILSRVLEGSHERS